MRRKAPCSCLPGGASDFTHGSKIDKCRGTIVNARTRALELRSLLCGWRARLKPEDVGLPMTIRRRVAGLRREEVAELVGVSPNWYALFESGAANRRFSAAFVQRVAEALCLDEHERSTLFRLALPEIRFAVEQFERSTHEGAIRDLQVIRTLVRRVSAAGSFADAAEAAVDAVFELLSPTSVAMAILTPTNGSMQTSAAGARAHVDLANSRIVETCMVANYPNRYGYTIYSEQRSDYRHSERGAFEFEQRTVEGASFRVTVTDLAPPTRDTLAGRFPAMKAEGSFTDAVVSAVEYWDWNSKLSVCSAMTHGLFTEGCYRGNLCALWTEPRRMSNLDAEILRTASAIIELAAGPAAQMQRRAATQ